MTQTKTNSTTDDLYETIRKYKEEAQKIYPTYPPQYDGLRPSPFGTCPSCGYCPHCGRGGQRTYPFITY